MRVIALILLAALPVVSFSADKAKTPAIDNSVHYQNPPADPNSKSDRQGRDADHPAFVKLMPAEESEKDKEDRSKKDAQALASESTRITLDYWIAVFTGIIAAFTVGLFYVARKTMRNQLRAWVGPAEAKVTTIDDRGPKKVTVKIKNYGPTPALNMYCYFCVYVVGMPIPKTLTASFAEDFRPSRATLFPGQSWTGDEKSPELLTDEEIADIKAGRKCVVAWGAVVYNDVFGKNHKTEFRMQQDADTIKSGNGMIISPSHDGNDAK